MAIAVGVVAGLAAWLFRKLIAFFHNLLFFQEISFVFDANLHTPGEALGLWVIVIPMVGAVAVAFLVGTFAPEAKGHGVPEVMVAIHHGGGRIRPAVVLVKSLASAISIGSGGSVGREGPIIQIGAAFGSLLGQWIAMPERQRVVLLAAGAGAAIAATFNAPLGGMIFAVELLLVSIHVGSLLPVALATVTATYIGRHLMGAQPAFDIPALEMPQFAAEPVLALLAFVPLSLVIGLAAVAFIRGLYWSEDFFEGLPGNYYSRHLLGMAALGLLLYLMQRFAGHYYVQGVGYATIFDILTGALRDPFFLLALFALKFLATCLTLGSGASGGVFSPSLFLGACLGSAFGHGVLAVAPDIGIGIPVFALAGMAAMIGAGTGALFTSIVMVTEMTGDHRVILPLLLCGAIAYALRKALCSPSLYTLKLLRRGQVVPEGLTAALLPARRLADVMAPLPEEGAALPRASITLPAATPLVEALRALEAAGADVVLVTDQTDTGTARPVGQVTAAEILLDCQGSAKLM